MALLGAAIACLFTGILADRLGRKPTLIFSDIFLIIGPALLWGSSTIPYLILGRFITGIGIGSSIMVSSIYLAESSPSKLRAPIVACYQIFNAFGILFSYCMGLWIQHKWQLMLGIGLLPAVIQQIIVTVWLDETP